MGAPKLLPMPRTHRFEDRLQGNLNEDNRAAYSTEEIHGPRFPKPLNDLVPETIDDWSDSIHTEYAWMKKFRQSQGRPHRRPSQGGLQHPPPPVPTPVVRDVMPVKRREVAVPSDYGSRFGGPEDEQLRT